MSSNKLSGEENSVVVVDGDETSRNELKALLEADGFTVITASKGSRALSLFQERPRLWKPVFVVVDSMLPDMSGYELVKQLSDQYSNKEAAYIMVAKYPGGEDVLEAKSSGALDCVQKPLTKEKWSELLEKHRIQKMKGEIGTMVFDINHL
ncbi:MAG: response regulator [Bdellovibrionales bacterium]|nr:response regulator [Bdellovibrionales bacterium]